MYNPGSKWNTGDGVGEFYKGVGLISERSQRGRAGSGVPLLKFHQPPLLGG